MILHADARALPLRDGCVQCCVTSPPFFGLRDYGHVRQIGLEAEPGAYVAALVAVFREVRRVLADDGVMFVNLGDSYANDGKWGGHTGGKHVAALHCSPIGRMKRYTGLKPKDLIGIPWAVAFALREDGWYLRSDIIWSKPNPMPESVTDRPTKAHEYLFLLSKNERYFYDAAAIAEVAVGVRGGAPLKIHSEFAQGPHGKTSRFNQPWDGSTVRNRRSVWTVTTQPYSGAHFATFPEELIEPCILAGSRVGDLVLDPFLGSGTVGVVCERYGRKWVGTDLAYHDLAKARTRQRGLLGIGA